MLPHDERNFGYTWVVKSFLEALFFASAFLFVEKFLLQLIGEYLAYRDDECELTLGIQFSPFISNVLS